LDMRGTRTSKVARPAAAPPSARAGRAWSSRACVRVCVCARAPARRVVSAHGRAVRRASMGGLCVCARASGRVCRRARARASARYPATASCQCARASVRVRVCVCVVGAHALVPVRDVSHMRIECLVRPPYMGGVPRTHVLQSTFAACARALVAMSGGPRCARSRCLRTRMYRDTVHTC
jgi:hypothetical protein